MKAVIVDIQGAYAAALCENGSVEKIPDDHYEIGQKIEMSAAEKPAAPKKLRGMSRSVRSLGTIAAVFVLVACTVSGIAYAMPYGTVSLDAGASIEYTINCFNYVIDVKALNDDGSAVLDGMDDGLLLNRQIDLAVSATLEQEGADGPAGDETGLVISVGTRGQAHSERLAGRLNDMMENDTSVPAQVIPVTMDDVEAAHENDMTAGRKWMQDNPAQADGSDVGNTEAADGIRGGENSNTGTAPEAGGRTAGQDGNTAVGGNGVSGQNSGNTQEVSGGAADSGTQNVRQTGEAGNENTAGTGGPGAGGSPNAAAAAVGSAEMPAGQR